jgi:hypothetical protein
MVTAFHTPSGDGARPGFDAHAGAWSRTRLAQVTPRDPRLDAVVRALDAVHNMSGGVQAAQFRIHADPGLADYFAHNRIEADFFRHFFSHPDVRDAFPGMPPPERDALGFQRKAAPDVIETLVHVIRLGGAYRCFAGTERDARKLANDFGAAIGPRFFTAAAWVSEAAWNGWFRNVAWDGSFFWFDRGTGIATVLLTTDTD